MGASNKFVRFQKGNGSVYGLLQEGEIQELAGGLFDPVQPNGQVHLLEDTPQLVP